MNCDKLIHERVALFRNISNIVPSFTTMSDVEKFMFLLTSHDFDICKVVMIFSSLFTFVLRVLLLLFLFAE
jgi:hypothetical protein